MWLQTKQEEGYILPEKGEGEKKVRLSQQSMRDEGVHSRMEGVRRWTEYAGR